MNFRFFVLMLLMIPFIFSCKEKKSTIPSPAITWQKCLGGSGNDIASSIQQTSDSGYIAVGSTGSNDGDVSGYHNKYDVWVVKLNSTGMLQWQITLGGSSNDYANSVQQTKDGGYIVAGYSGSNDGDLSENHGGYDAWITKLDSAGKIQWEKSFGGTENDYVYAIQQTDDGGYIFAGNSMSKDGDVTGNHGSFDYWIVKLDSKGIMQWQKSLGGKGFEEARSIKQTSDGGYIIAGFSVSKDGDVTGNHGEQDFWVVKLNSSGNLQWQKSLGGSSKDNKSSNGEDYAYSVQQTKDGGYIVAGYSGSNDGDATENHGKNHDFWVVKLNSSGVLQWQKSLGGTLNDAAYSIQQTKDGRYIVAGVTESNDGDVIGKHDDGDFWIINLNSEGNINWQKCLGGHGLEEVRSIQQTLDGGYIVAGYTYSNDGDVSGNHSINSDFWIVKLK